MCAPDSSFGQQPVKTITRRVAYVAATHSVCCLTYSDMTPVCQMAAQRDPGRKI